MVKYEDKVNPQMVTLARESRGLTQPELARLLSVNQGWLSRIEAGLRGIQEESLTQLAEVLRYPVDFFKIKEELYGLGISGVFHRKLQSASHRNLKRIHALIYIRSREIKQLLMGVDIADTNKIPNMPIEEYENPSDIAQIVRASWHMPQGPVNNLTSVIESAKGIIIPFDFNTKDIDAVVHHPPESPPLFFINIFSPTDRLRFTLCHELGHLVMHQNTLDIDNIEQQAKEFAAEFLMPQKAIKHQFTDLSIEKLTILKQFWKVSMAALIKRASDLQAITPSKSKQLWVMMGKLGYRIREPVELDIPPENPTLLTEIIETYTKDMDYSVGELSKFLYLTEDETTKIYIDLEQQAIEKEKKSAVREVNRILRDSLNGKNRERGGDSKC
jgi:Zn-dependent peptidase ImmA (M78 family)/DNA-binding XRE family transcriptional regulator